MKRINSSSTGLSLIVKEFLFYKEKIIGPDWYIVFLDDQATKCFGHVIEVKPAYRKVSIYEDIHSSLSFEYSQLKYDISFERVISATGKFEVLGKFSIYGRVQEMKRQEVYIEAGVNHADVGWIWFNNRRRYVDLIDKCWYLR